MVQSGKFLGLAKLFSLMRATHLRISFWFTMQENNGDSIKDVMKSKTNAERKIAA